MNFLRIFTALSHVDPPKFSPPPSSTVVGFEGESLTVGMVANGNPMSIAYTWTKEGLPIQTPGKYPAAAVAMHSL